MINYQKRKNSTLFQSLEKPNTLFLSKMQNYIPIYNRFFGLNETNFNNINFNNKWFLLNINEKDQSSGSFLNGTIKNIKTDKTKKKDIFFK